VNLIPKPPRRPEALAVWYLLSIAAALFFAAFETVTVLNALWRIAAFVAGVLVLGFPWIVGARLRAAVTTVVMFVVLLRLVGLIYYQDNYLGACLWVSVLFGLLLITTQDQDQTFREKLEEGPIV